MQESSEYSRLLHEIESLRQENARLHAALEEAQLKDSDEVIRAIHQGEIDALVVQQQGQEHIYSLQTFDAVYRMVVEECFPFGVWLTETDGRILYISPSFLNLLGINLQQMRDRGQFHFLAPKFREELERQWQQAREAGEVFDAEYKVPLNDGSEKTIWTHGLLAQTPDGLQRWAGVNIDISDRIQVQDELRQQADALREADRQKDEFLALLGHELRNPLAPLRNALHVLLRPDLGEGVVGDVKEIMEKQVNHLTRLVDDLLDVARISQGKIELLKERVDLKVAVNNAVASVRPLIDARNHRLSVSLPEEPIDVEADPTRFEQILVNLLNNAAKYTKHSGEIRLSAAEENGEAVVRIRDNGMGISPELLPRIFNLFAQAETTLDRSQGGLGIGLTLVRKLVELHGGSVTAFSEGQGRGSEFVVRMAALPTETGDSESDMTEAAGADNKMRVLVVDDSIDTAHTLKLFLEFSGHDVRAVYDGPSALVAVRTYQPDVVFLDLGLPGMDGYDVARQLQRQLESKRPMLVAVSGYGQDEDKRRAHEAGFDLHVTKPADPRKLIAIIASAAGRQGR